MSVYLLSIPEASSSRLGKESQVPALPTQSCRSTFSGSSPAWVSIWAGAKGMAQHHMPPQTTRASVDALFHAANSISHRYHYFIRQRDSRVIRGIAEGEGMEKENREGGELRQHCSSATSGGTKLSHPSCRAAEIPEQMTPYLGHCSGLAMAQRTLRPT